MRPLILSIHTRHSASSMGVGNLQLVERHTGIWSPAIFIYFLHAIRNIKNIQNRLIKFFL